MIGLIFLSERFFFHHFQNFGNNWKYSSQYTEAFCHYSWNSPEATNLSSLNFTYLEEKSGKYGRLKIVRKNVEIMGEKLSDKSDPSQLILKRDVASPQPEGSQFLFLVSIESGPCYPACRLSTRFLIVLLAARLAAVVISVPYKID